MRPHLFLALLLGFVGVALLDLVEFGLEVTHRLRVLLHADLALAGDRVQERSNHDHQEDDRDAPVEADAVDEREEDDHEVRQPGERAEGTAATHQVEDQSTHVQGDIGLGDVQDRTLERPGEDAHVPVDAGARIESLHATDQGSQQVRVIRGSADHRIDRLDRGKPLRGVVRRVIRRMDAECEVSVG